MRDTKDTENRRPLPDAEADGIIEGRNAVIEALRVGTPLDKIYIAKGETDKTLGWWRPTGASWTTCPAPTPIRA